MIGRVRQLLEPRLRQKTWIEKSQTPVGIFFPMGEKVVSSRLYMIP